MFLFSKMQATGNDFVILNYLNNKLKYSYKLLSNFICDRHFGIGADGILILDKSNTADFKMRIFNKDGTEGEMCGNGIRCLAKYVYEKKLTNKKVFFIETIAGIKKVELEVEGSTVISVKVNIGKFYFEKTKIPMIYDEKQRKVKIDKFETYSVSTGNPHTVCFVENIKDVDVEKYGKLIENYKYFPNKTNVEFVEIKNRNSISIRIWERGVGETMSCGTGVCAAVVVSNKYKNIDNKCIAQVLGGRLEVEIINNEVLLKGPAEFVFEGKIKI